MKKMMNHRIWLCLLMMSTGTAMAQNQEKKEVQEKRVIRIKMMDEKNGVKREIDTSIVLAPGQKAEDVMKGLQLEHIPSLKAIPGDSTQVIIHKKCDDKKMIIRHFDQNDSLPEEIKMLLQEGGITLPDSAMQIMLNSEIIRKAPGRENSDETQVMEFNDGKVKKQIILRRITIVELSPEDKEHIKQLKNDNNRLHTEELSFYPNPGNGRFVLSFNLDKKADTEIHIYNMQGQEVYLEKIKDFTGRFQKEIDLSENGKGVYFLKLQQGRDSISKKIIIN